MLHLIDKIVNWLIPELRWRRMWDEVEQQRLRDDARRADGRLGRH